MIYFIVLLIGFFQATLINFISIGNIKPDLLLISVIFIALYKNLIYSVSVGILAGFLEDIFTTGLFLNTFILPICCFAVGLFVSKFNLHKDKILVQIAVVSSVSVFLSFAYLVWFSGWNYAPSLLALTVFIAIPTVLYNALASIPAFSLFKRLFGVVSKTSI